MIIQIEFPFLVALGRAWVGVTGSTTTGYTAQTTATTYDVRRRTRQQTLTPSGGSAQSTSFGYDGANTRTGLTTSGQTTSYLQDTAGGLPVALQERVGTNTPSSYLYGLGSTSPLMQTTAGSVTAWYHSDALGSVRVISSSSAAILNTSSYSAYGTPTFTSGSTPNTHGYAGEQIDPTGLSYNRARYYDAGIGRFTQRDTYAGSIQLLLSLNRYTYSQDNPTGGIDPSGLYECDSRRPVGIGGSVSTDYGNYCDSLKAMLDATQAFLDKAYRGDSLGALEDLFSNNSPFDQLPGGTAVPTNYQHNNMSAAKQRLEFVLWYTDDHSGFFSHFHPHWGQGGLNPAFQDANLSASVNPQGDVETGKDDGSDAMRDQNGNLIPGVRSPQIGHFLSGVSAAYAGIEAYERCFVGHEIDNSSGIGVIGVCDKGTAAWKLAESAKDFDLMGLNCLRDILIGQIVGLPEQYDPVTKASPNWGRSRQDLRLTLKAFELGEAIRDNQIQSLEGVNTWLESNLRYGS